MGENIGEYRLRIQAQSKLCHLFRSASFICQKVCPAKKVAKSMSSKQNFCEEKDKYVICRTLKRRSNQPKMTL